MDPTKRVLVPLETRQRVSQTSDYCVYVRAADGSLRRARPKIRGKAARKREKQLRQES